MHTDDRPTLRSFAKPKERTGKAYRDALAQLRVAELEIETARLTRDLSERTGELLEALEALETAGLI